MTTMTIPTLNAYRVGGRYVAVRLHVPGSLEPRTSSSTPLHLAILLDISGSMEGPRLDAVKRTLRAARDMFQATDRVTLIVFDDAATTIAAGLRMTAEGKDRFYERLERITAQGCTNLSAGLEKLLEVQQTVEEPYTGLIILTDGHINRGIVSNTGLRTLVTGLADGFLPVTALGYGAEHNRTLLRDLALRSRGAYTYVDSDETLPIVMGDLLAGQRCRVLQRASVDLDVVDGDMGWTSAELDGDGARHVIGDVVPDRDYWVVYQNNATPPPQRTTAMTVTLRSLTLDDGAPVTTEVLEVANTEAEEQVLRCRVAAVSAAVTNLLERSERPEDAYRIQLLAMRTAIESRPQPHSPLLHRLRAQIAELLEAMAAVPEQPDDAVTPPGAWASPSPPGPNSVMLARLSSNTAQLSLQRGVSTSTSVSDIGDPAPVAMFSSPVQVAASTTCRTNYRNRSPSPSPSS